MSCLSYRVFEQVLGAANMMIVAPAAPPERRAIVRVVIQCRHKLFKAPARVALREHALGEAVLCVHNCPQQTGQPNLEH